MSNSTYPFEPVKLVEEGIWIVRDRRDGATMPGEFRTQLSAFRAAMIHAHMMTLGHPRPDRAAQAPR